MIDDNELHGMIDAEKMRQALLEVSSKLTEFVRIFEADGWTEEQARDIVVTSYVAAFRSRTKKDED